MVIFIMIVVVLIIFFGFSQQGEDASCSKVYGKDWHLVTKGQDFCKDSKGDLKDIPQ